MTEDLDNPSYRYERIQYMDTETAVALVPDNIMNAIVESARVSATLRDLYFKEVIFASSPLPKKEFNPSRRDSY